MTKKQILTIGAVIVVVIALWTWYDLGMKPANARIQQGVQQIVAREPAVGTMYAEAMKDGVLTTWEAKRIINKANELKGK